MSASPPDVKQVQRYRHDESRKNNPEAGLPQGKDHSGTEKDTWAYSQHLSPELDFDIGRAQVEKIIEEALLRDDEDSMRQALQRLKKMQDPYLNWSGKKESTSFDVDQVSLHVHERIDPATILAATEKMRKNGTERPQGTFDEALSEEPFENLPLRKAVEFYRHEKNWANRLITGDSLLVMNSLLQKESMAGSVQMIYIDPPYGIKYGSNFQPFVNRRDVTDGRDEDLTQEPEQIKAFRDTWKLHTHSYLTYLRDRFILARELLADTGSCFVQISDENVHHVRELMDDVFGAANFVVSIIIKKKSATTVTNPINDYVLWYAKDKQQIKVKQIFEERKGPGEDGKSKFNTLISPDGDFARVNNLSGEELNKKISDSWRWARLDYPIVSQGYQEERSKNYLFKGRSFDPPEGRHWGFSTEGLDRLAAAFRLFDGGGRSLSGIMYWDEWPYLTLSNIWDFHGQANPVYVVQTNTKIVERCMLMTTDPGDLVFDPTCGSGTTAYVAEQWGRRWMTCDTSRVAITLARQRLMTASFPWYTLAYPEQEQGDGVKPLKTGLRGGFKYKTVPHVTLRSIANNPDIKPGLSRAEIAAAIARYADKETLYDQPVEDKNRLRICGPFTLEAVPSPVVQGLDAQDYLEADASIARRGETARQAQWRDELLKSGVRGKNKQTLKFSELEVLPSMRYLHASGQLAETGERVVCSFGPEHAAMDKVQVEQALQDAQRLVPQPRLVLYCAFSFDAEAAKNIEETNWPGVNLLKVQMNADLLTEDLKSKQAGSQNFWLMGQPEISLSQGEAGRWVVEVHGFDYFDTEAGSVISGGRNKIAVWSLDTDYDGRALFPRQVFFPLAGERDGWYRLGKTLRAELDLGRLEAFRGTRSLPFEAGEHKQVAVKLVDDRGIESLRVLQLG